MRTKNQGVLKADIFDKIEINDGHYLELLDRTWVTMANINSNLLEHPLVEHEKEIEKLLEEAISNLWEVYQILGTKLDDNG